MNDAPIKNYSAFGLFLFFLWGAFVLFWFFKESGLFHSIIAWRCRTCLWLRMLAFVLFAAIVVHGGGKGKVGEPSRTVRIPRAYESRTREGTSASGAAEGGLRFTSFSVVDDRFEMAVEWPATNGVDHVAVDVYHKRRLDDPQWRWVHREEFADVMAPSNMFQVSKTELPFCEIQVNWGFSEQTNVVMAPFGVEFSNIVSRVAVATEPSSGFFLAGNQHDSDSDGAPDMVETSLGLDPLDPDMDGDGIPDGRELLAGSSPTFPDTDGDGIPDSIEVSWGRASTNGLARWIDMTASTNRILLFEESDDGQINLPMPMPFRLFGRPVTNLSVSANGLVCLAEGELPSAFGSPANGLSSQIPVADDPSATVAAFWDDLCASSSMGSCISVAEFGPEGSKATVIEFSHVGFFSGTTNDFVSFQIQFSEAETNAVLVVFSEASGLGSGSSATLGTRSSRDDGVEYACNEPDVVFPGLLLEYHFGLGSDPSKADTDGDGLSDAGETALGTDPREPDTDGDGLSDGDEGIAGTDPLNPDSDGDLLPDGWESEQGFNPHDPDDGLSDADRDGLTIGEELFLHRTNPVCWDSDADGLSDADELVQATDPLEWDTDGDDLPDGFEVRVGTNPLSVDTDGDGLDDGWEHHHGPFDPRDPTDGAADFDGDNLSARDEIVLWGTNWRKADTDGDGLSDSAEIAAGTDPLKADTDGDGLSDSQETAQGTNPNRTDTDGDGCSDGWEVSHGFNPLSALFPVTSSDPDGDGLTNGEEARLGTDPFSADTDGDGLSDRAEVGWVSAGNGVFHDLLGATNLLSVLFDPDSGSASVPLPFPVRVQNAWICSNLVVNVDGLVNLVPEPSISWSFWPDEGTPLVVKAFSDDLQAFPAELGSSLRAGGVITNGVRHFVVEYRSFGFYWTDIDPTNAVSFQIDFDEDSTNEVRVSFFRADCDGSPTPPLRSEPSEPLSARALGDNAVLGVATPRTELVFSNGEPVAVPGLGIVYHLGTGTNPLLPDSDGDGIPDAAELAEGTDPNEWDTDGDGLSDGEEVNAGTDPVLPNAGVDATDADPDGDGLTNGMESFLGSDWRLADTDGDGVSDGAEWRQGSDPLDSADFASRDTVEVTVRFGDDSGSHSEKYEATVTPVSGDSRGPVTVRNREFGEPDEFTLFFVSNAVYEVSLRHAASSRSSPDLDYTLEIAVSGFSSGIAALVLDPEELTGEHENVDVSQFDKTARVAVVRARLLADKNRDGSIDDADDIPGPLRMWINDDRDDGSVASGDSDVPTGGSCSFFSLFDSNCRDDQVNGMSDLEDYFPVWLDVREAISVMERLCPNSLVVVKLFHHDAAVGIVNTDLTRTSAGAYLCNPDIAAGYSSSGNVIVGSNGIQYPSSDFSRLIADSEKGVSLIEGLDASSNPLVLQLLLDERPVLQTELELSIAPVERFYRWVNLRHVVGGGEDRPTDPPGGAYDPEVWRDMPETASNVIFIHGFNVTEREARGWNSEMFKRLWQSGFNAKFHAVTWRGDVGFPNGLFYHDDVESAFTTSAAFSSSFAAFSAKTAVFAHSLGNMVVCSAIQDYGFRPNKFFMLNAAVPAEALDSVQWNDSSAFNPMLHEEWFDFPSDTWCSHWHRLFSGTDARKNLTWNDRFGDVADRADLYNYYSTGDQVLCLFSTPDAGGSGSITVEGGTGGSNEYHSWQKQERFKGRFGVDIWLGNAGTAQMGWGFSELGFWEDGEPPMYDEEIGLGALFGVPARLSPYTVEQAEDASSAQLRADPVFRHIPESILEAGTQTFDEIGILLARGVPALSGPVGSRPILLNSSVVNVDMNSKRFETGWPRNAEPEFSGWRHGDIRAIAFPFTRGVFDDFLSELEDNE